MSPPAADVAGTIETLNTLLQLTVDLTARMLQAEGERDQALSEREAAAERSRHLESANESLSKELSEHQDELRAALVQRDTLTAELDKQEEALHASLTERTKLTDELTAKVLQAEGERDQALSEREAAAERSRHLESANESLSKELSEHQDELRAALVQRDTLTAELDKQEEALHASLTERTKLTDELTAKVLQAEGERDQALSEREAAAQRSRHLESANESLSKELSEHQDELRKAESHRDQALIEREAAAESR